MDTLRAEAGAWARRRNGVGATTDWQFTNEQAREFYRKRLRYTVARWGYSPHVLCWEFGNEIQGWAGDTMNTCALPVFKPNLVSRYSNWMKFANWRKKTSYPSSACTRIPAVEYFSRTIGKMSLRP